MSAASPPRHVGVDVGGTTTRVVAFDPARVGGPATFDAQRHQVSPGVKSWRGAVLGSAAAATPAGADAIVECVSSLVQDVAPDGVARVGLGIPGQVVDGVVRGAINLSIDGPVDIAHLLSASLGAPVHVENDVNAAALGAFVHLGLPATASLAYVNVGTGIAAGYVLGGRLWRGTSGAAGEIGHLPMRVDGPACACGQVGCAEAIGAGRVVADPARRAEALDAIAWTVQLCVMALDVDHVVVGGGVVEQGPVLLEELHRRLAAIVTGATGLPPIDLAGRVQLAPVGVPLGSLGALLAAHGTGDAA